jgi:hypothetical protein
MVHEYAKVLSIDYGAEFTEVEAEAPESIRRRLAGYLAEGPMP